MVVRGLESLRDADKRATEESSKQSKEIGKLQQTIKDLKDAKAVAENDLKKANLNVGAAKISNDELKSALETAKLARTNLEAKVDLVEARVVHVEAEKTRA